MRYVLRGLAPPILFFAAAALGRAQAHRPPTWQADVQIRTLEITKSRSALSARVVVYTENDDEAVDARLLILLPIGVGVERLDTGCAASAGPSMVPSLRATVSCQLGPIVDRGFREVNITTTLPPEDLPRRFAVFAWSGTPDPLPGNNYAERTLP